MENNQKWLLYFFQNISVAQWFFIIMGAMTLLFIKLMMGYYDKATQRNFRKDSVEEKRKTDIIKKN